MIDIITEYIDKNYGKMALVRLEGEIWICRMINEKWVTHRKMTEDDKKILKQAGIIIEF
jgi:hypothetical protein